MKLVSWNVNGLRACEGKGFSESFKSLDADIFCLQETKMQSGQLDLEFPGYKSFWNYAEKKGYSGTAVFTKVEPLNVTYGIGIEEHDREGWSLPWNSTPFTWFASIPLTPRKNSRDWITECSGKTISGHIW